MSYRLSFLLLFFFFFPLLAEEPPTHPNATVRETGIRPDLLYNVLVGEIAAQRKELDLAYTHLLQAAQRASDPVLAEQAARIALKRGQPSEIQQAIETWLRIAPQSMKAHQVAARICLQKGNMPCAEQHLHRLVALASAKGKRSFLQIARLVARIQPAEKRLQLLQSLAAKEPENADLWFTLALVKNQAGQRQDAVVAARRAVQLRAEWQEPRIFLIETLRNLHRTQEAQATLEKFIAENPNDAVLRKFYAQLLVDDEKFSEAREVFAQLAKEQPADGDSLFALGILSLQLEDWAAARKSLTQLYEGGKRSDEAAYYLGRTEEASGNLDQAIQWYYKVRNKQALDARIRIALLEAKQGHLNQAREILHRARDRWRKKAVSLYIVEAELLADQDRNEEALQVYDEALKAHPNDPKLLYARALHGVSMHRLDILEQDLRTLLKIEPNNAEALNALGYTLADQTDRYEEALQLIEKALVLRPDDPAILDSMGWVQYRLGHLTEARKYLEQALADLQDGEIAAHLGEVLWALGEREAARQVWEKARQEEPDHAYLLRVIQRHADHKADAKTP